MTIFEFINGKEVLFGWEFPGVQNGHCFLTKNDKLVEFFEDYFSYYERTCDDPDGHSVMFGARSLKNGSDSLADPSTLQPQKS
jgi:hypothetical protein